MYQIQRCLAIRSGTFSIYSCVADDVLVFYESDLLDSRELSQRFGDAKPILIRRKTLYGMRFLRDLSASDVARTFLLDPGHLQTYSR